MHLDFGKTRVGSKVYTRVLLRESFRDQGKVKHRTIANLSACSPEEIAAIRKVPAIATIMARLSAEKANVDADAVLAGL